MKRGTRTTRPKVVPGARKPVPEEHTPEQTPVQPEPEQAAKADEKIDDTPAKPDEQPDEQPDDEPDEKPEGGEVATVSDGVVTVEPVDVTGEDDDKGEAVRQPLDGVVVEDLAPAADLKLGEDPDTSMLPAVQLHLVSEHGISAALHMDDATAAATHLRHHTHYEHDHTSTDWRFRPLRAVSTLMANVETETSDLATT